MSAPRFLYVCHDLPQMTGGMRQIYQHVDRLVRNGFPAFIVHRERLPGMVTRAPKAPMLFMSDQISLAPDDVVIIPEDHQPILHNLAQTNVRKIIFCQNHFYIPAGLGSHRDWRELGIEGVMATSPRMADFISATMKYSNIAVVPCAIDLDLFQPREKKPQIAFMPRKLPKEIEFIRWTFEKLWQGPPVSWQAIDNMTQPQVAQVLGESAIFLSTAVKEGFGLPPIEAMSCGCVVVGFHGDGGLDYANASNGFWCECLDLIGCARTLVRVAEAITRSDPAVAAVISAARQSAARYSPANQERALLEFARNLLEEPGMQAH